MDGVTWDQLAEMYSKIEESAYAPPEPIKLTREQLAWLKTRVPVRQSDPLDPSPMLTGVPIHLVDDVAESTPVEKGWAWGDTGD